MEVDNDDKDALLSAAENGQHVPAASSSFKAVLFPIERQRSGRVYEHYSWACLWAEVK